VFIEYGILRIFLDALVMIIAEAESSLSDHAAFSAKESEARMAVLSSGASGASVFGNLDSVTILAISEILKAKCTSNRPFLLTSVCLSS
jgi:ApbE superfamily uncharacterized protein (UPF0280 family)